MPYQTGLEQCSGSLRTYEIDHDLPIKEVIYMPLPTAPQTYHIVYEALQPCRIVLWVQPRWRIPHRQNVNDEQHAQGCMLPELRRVWSAPLLLSMVHEVPETIVLEIAPKLPGRIRVDQHLIRCRKCRLHRVCQQLSFKIIIDEVVQWP